MPDPYWENLKEIFHAALALPPPERAAYLDQASNGDLSLRHAVESLLKSHEQTENFVDVPAYQAAAEMLVNPVDLKAGKQIAHYRIVRLLGEGGMGTVYLAEDTKLRRMVSLKFLSTRFIQDRERLRRFEQEARAASALNNPNILTIHEIGEAEGHRFIATEYIEGQTLRERLGSAVEIDDALDVAIQVAQALVAAHRVNIVHRDIKPENLMIRRDDGLVKILDFGLAKMSATRSAKTEIDGEAETRMREDTAPGVIMGTVAYMSPEQARGDAVDARTDIWSLGVVLYEMIAGASPFVAGTSNEIISGILSKQPPPPLARYSREVPERLEEIVEKALTKNREERYQTSQDLLIDLKRLRQSLEFQAGIERIATDRTRVQISGAQSRAGDGTASLSTTATRGTASRVSESLSTRPSSVEYLVNRIQTHRRGVFLVLASFLLLVAGMGYGIYRLARGVRAKPGAPSFTSMKIARVTSSGRVFSATISPDGRYLAYLDGEGGHQSLHLKQIKTGGDVQTIPAGNLFENRLNFSLDGEYVYYRVFDAKTFAYTLYEIPSFGGTPRKVTYDIDSPPTFSPDGKQIAFVRGDSPVQGKSYLMVADSNGANEKILATHDENEAFDIPTWSPDGQTIVCAERFNPISGSIRLIAVSTADGLTKQLGESVWTRLDRLAWLPEGSGLLMTAADPASFSTQLWFAAYPSGEVKRITNDLNNYTGITLTKDGAKLVVLQSITQTDVWISDGRQGEVRQITSNANNANGLKGFSFTPDGRLVYYAHAAGDDLWKLNTDGSIPEQLTTNEAQNLWPEATQDGRYIVFSSNRNGKYHVWRMNVDGSDQKQLTFGPTEFYPSCSPDGKWVVYQSFDEKGLETFYKVSIDGGVPQRLTEMAALYPRLSPDGKQVAGIFQEDYGRPAHIGVMPSDGGQVTMVRDMPASALRLIDFPLKWTPDGKAIAFIDAQDNGTYNLRGALISGGALQQLTDFKSGMIFWFGWSVDGKQLAMSRGQRISDAVEISDFK